MLLTSLGICVYYALQYPPIGLALPIAAALFSVAEAGHLRVGIIVSAALITLSLYFQIVSGQDVGQLRLRAAAGDRADGGASLALGDGVRSRRLSRSRSGIWNASSVGAGAQGVEQRNEERLRLARDLHDALGHSVAISLQSAVAAEALPARVPEAQRAVAEIRDISVATMAELGSTVRRSRARWTLVVELPAGLDELPTLAKQARGNGLDVRIAEIGDHRDMPDELGRAAYRNRAGR